MRISLNWLKKYVEVKIPDDELVRLIGARLVEVEAVIDETHKYDNIYIVKVVEAQKIPDTHLSLCQIDVGGGEIAKQNNANENGLVQVVCGAPNVREGMLAVWIAPGATVPASCSEDAPFVIGKRRMLGKYDSHGMLAGADELDFSDKHDKIAEIDPDMAKPGELLADVFGLEDLILDIENKSLTHRPDCFGLVGFAREVAGILGEKFHVPFSDESTKDLAHNSLNAVQKKARQKEELTQLKIAIADPEICERYSALVLTKHGELKSKYLTEREIILAKAGMRPIDPIVDATNYWMLLTGQPLHAFDYDKFIAVGGTRQPDIQVRLARKGEKLLLLDGKEIELETNDIVIASGKTPVALAGAMGGASTEIDTETKNIILESATFSLYHLRKTQMAHGIFSEAITRFTKGQPAYQTMQVAERCANDLTEGFRVAMAGDEYPESAQPIVVKITTDEINQLLGTDYSVRKIIKTLENVNFTVTASAGEAAIQVAVPAWRTDIHIKEDVIEEIGRLLGYDNIAPVLPLHQTARPNALLELKECIRQTLRRLGANEILTYSFVSGKLLEKASLEAKNSYKIVNSISPELQYVRQSLVPSLLDKAYLNQKIPFDKFALFELNQVYRKDLGLNEEKVPVMENHLGLVLAERKTDPTAGEAYYKARKYLERLLAEFHLVAEFEPLGSPKLAMAQPFEPQRTALAKTGDGQILGVVGEFKNSVRHEFKLAPFVAGFEIDLDILLKCARQQAEIYLGKKEKRDLTVVTSGTYGELIAKIRKTLYKQHLTAEIAPLMIYQPEGAKKDTVKHISVHLEFREPFTDVKITKVMRELEKLN